MCTFLIENSGFNFKVGSNCLGVDLVYNLGCEAYWIDD